MPFEIISRSEWKAQERPYEAVPLPSPIRSVQLIYDTECDQCVDKEDCIDTVQELQKLHMDTDGLKDINYNFLIGGDKNIYECRGWHKSVEKHPNWTSPSFKDRLVVGFIGFHERGPPLQYLSIFEDFVKEFTNQGILCKDGVDINI